MHGSDYNYRKVDRVIKLMLSLQFHGSIGLHHMIANIIYHLDEGVTLLKDR